MMITLSRNQVSLLNDTDASSPRVGRRSGRSLSPLASAAGRRVSLVVQTLLGKVIRMEENPQQSRRCSRPFSMSSITMTGFDEDSSGEMTTDKSTSFEPDAIPVISAIQGQQLHPPAVASSANTKTSLHVRSSSCPRLDMDTLPSRPSRRRSVLRRKRGKKVDKEDGRHGYSQQAVNTGASTNNARVRSSSCPGLDMDTLPSRPSRRRSILGKQGQKDNEEDVSNSYSQHKAIEKKNSNDTATTSFDSLPGLPRRRSTLTSNAASTEA